MGLLRRGFFASLVGAAIAPLTPSVALAQPALNGGVPRGTIIAWWAKAGESPPDGWVLCDGTNGTPDLRNRFMRGGSSLADLTGQPAGSDSHSHTFSATTNAPKDGINHNCSQGDHGIDLAGNDHQHDLSGQTGAGSNVPVHVVVLFLMKK